MTRSTARWITALAAAALIGLPAAGFAQQTNQTSQSTTAPADTAAQTGTTAAKGLPNQTAARQHLSAARDVLSQVAQMPEAGKLQGDARTQVSQLISNFNELITTQTDWHAAYGKVEANLNALLGPAATDESAVGTSGTSTVPVDPAVRAKLLEVRRELQQFQQAAGGPAAAAGASMTANGAAANPAGSATAPAAAAPATAATPAETTAAPTDDAQRHLDAIAEIVNRALGMSGASNAPSAAGTPANLATSTTGGDVKIDRAQLEQIRMHVEQLRQLLKAGGK